MATRSQRRVRAREGEDSAEDTQYPGSDYEFDWPNTWPSGSGGSGPAIITSPVIAGTVLPDETLTLTQVPVWDGTETSSSWVWTADGVNIPGSTDQNSIAVPSSGLADRYRVVASATNDEGTRVIRSNELLNAQEAPVISTPPTLDNTSPLIGNTITASSGTVTGVPTPDITWEFYDQNNLVLQPESEFPDYTVLAQDAGKRIRVLQYAKNGIAPDAISESALTDAVAAPDQPPVITGEPTIDNLTPMVGDALTVTPAPVTASPPSTTSWQWFSNLTPVGTDSPTYTTVSSDEGNTITVVQNEANGVLPDASATSPGTDPVGPAPFAPSISASATLVGRTYTIQVDNFDGNPVPSRNLTTLTLDGVDVLGDVTGSEPWVYEVPSSLNDQTVAWTVTAANGVLPNATDSGSDNVPSDLVPSVTVTSVVAGPQDGDSIPIAITATGAQAGDTVYWVLYTEDQPIPTAAQIEAGQGSDGNPAIDSGNDVWPGPFSATIGAGVTSGDYQMAVTINNGAEGNAAESNVVTITIAPTGPVFSDDFDTYALNSRLIASNPDYASIEGSDPRINPVGICRAENGYDGVYHNTVLTGSSYYAQTTIEAIGAVNRVYLDYVDGNNSYYMNFASSGNWSFVKREGGSDNQLDFGSGGDALAAGHVIRLTRDGNDLVVSRDTGTGFTEHYRVTDTTFSTGVGGFMVQNSAPGSISNFTLDTL